MATFNISKGREVEFYNRVLTNDPANSALIMMVLATGSAGIVDALLDLDTFAAILAGGYTEVTNAGYARKTLTNADLAAWAPDDTTNTTTLYLPIQTWSAVAAGDVWDIIVVGYDNDTTGGTDANIVPVTANYTRVGGTPIPATGDDIFGDFSVYGWVQAT
jgi:hypothetical protein